MGTFGSCRLRSLERFLGPNERTPTEKNHAAHQYREGHQLTRQGSRSQIESLTEEHNAEETGDQRVDDRETWLRCGKRTSLEGVRS